MSNLFNYESENASFQQFLQFSKNLKEQASPFVVLNTWLGRKDIQIKLMAVVVAVFCGGLLWLSIENHRAKKVIEEINALTATSEIEKPNDWQRDYLSAPPPPISAIPDPTVPPPP